MGALTGLSGLTATSGIGGGGLSINFARTDLRLALDPLVSTKYSDDGTTVVTSGAVYRINDLSSYGQHLRQSTGIRQPTINTTGGKTSLAFDGSNDYMENTGTWNAKTAFTLVFSMSMQVFPTPGTNDATIVNIGNGSFDNAYVSVTCNNSFPMSNNAYDGAVKGIYPASANAATTPTITTWQLWTMKFTGSVWTIARNGTVGATVSAGNSATDYTRFTVGSIFGGGRYANVRIGKLCYFDAALTGTDLANVESYVASGYV